MKSLPQIISHLLLVAWVIVLAGPAISPLEEVVSAFFADEDAGECCCGDVCACEGHDDMACNTAADESQNTNCVHVSVLFSSIGLLANGYLLPKNFREELNLPVQSSEPCQVILGTLDHPPRASFTV